MLIQQDLPPIVIPKALREEYLKVLNEADRAIKSNLLQMDKYEQLLFFMGNEFKKSYWNNFLV